MKLVDIWDLSQNFWKMNPQLKLAFKDVYDGDSSRNKQASSSLMWAIALFIDPKSKFKDLTVREREALIKKDFYSDFSVKKYLGIVDKWKSFLSPAERQLLLWEQFMDEKNEYMRGLNYADNGDEIEKRLLSNGKLYEELKRLHGMITEEEAGGTVKGGAIESLSERGDI